MGVKYRNIALGSYWQGPSARNAQQKQTNGDRIANCPNLTKREPPCHLPFLFSLCAWALEELRGYEAFAEWSESALEPWYEMQLTSPQADLPETTDGTEPGATLVYKALHMLPYVGGSYVLSLFEEGSADGGLVLRAFDRANRETFWLPLPRKKLASFDSNAARTPASMAMALSLRLKMKVDGASGSRRLVLPPGRNAEPDKRNKRSVTKRARVATSGVDDAAAGAGEVTAASPPPSDAAVETAAAATLEEPSGQSLPQRRGSHPPLTRGSTTDDLSPLVEGEGDNDEDSTGEARTTPLVSSAVEVVEGGGSDAARVEQGLETREGSEEETVSFSLYSTTCARCIRAVHARRYHPVRKI